MPRSASSLSLRSRDSSRNGTPFPDDDGITEVPPLEPTDPGIVIFQVENKYFELPRTMLALNSYGLGGMLSASHDTGEPIKLSDTAKEFSVLCRTLRRPFSSPLFDPEPVFSDVLTLLKLSHKYCISSLERQSLRIVLQLTRSEGYQTIYHHLRTVRPSISSASDEVASVANTIQNETLLRSVAESYLNIWSHHNRGQSLHIDIILDGQLSTYKPLRFAKKHCQSYPDLHSTFLYEAMITGAENWGKDTKIPPEDKVLLGIGTSECCRAWEETVANWNTDFATAIQSRREESAIVPSCKCSRGRSHCKLTSNVMAELTRVGKQVPAYDLFAKLRSMFDLEILQVDDRDDEDPEDYQNWDCRNVAFLLIEDKIRYHQSKLPSYFQLE